jgi:uncharacterized protein YfaA (DUF2138 family)
MDERRPQVKSDLPLDFILPLYVAPWPIASLPKLSAGHSAAAVGLPKLVPSRAGARDL